MENTDSIKLSISIKNAEPVDLMNLTTGLQSLAKLYSDFNEGDYKAKLLVKEVYKGSINIDLISSYIGSIFPLISDVNNIIQFCMYVYLIITTLKKKPKEEIERIKAENILPDPNTKAFKNFKNILSMNGNSVDCKTEMSAVNINNSKVFFNCTFNGMEAAELKKCIDEIVKAEEGKPEYCKCKQLFRWVQTNFNNYRKGNKGIIENIARPPLRVIFDNETIQNEMTMSTGQDKVEWQDKYYIVDVEVLMADGKPTAYKIINNYADESFPIK